MVSTHPGAESAPADREFHRTGLRDSHTYNRGVIDHVSLSVKDFAASRGYGTEWAPGAEFATFMARGDTAMGKTMKAVGLAK